MYAHVDQLQETFLKARKQEWLLVCRNVAEKKIQKVVQSKERSFFVIFSGSVLNQSYRTMGKRGKC